MNPCVQCMNFNLLNLLVNISAWLLSLLFLSLPLILYLPLYQLFFWVLYIYTLYICASLIAQLVKNPPTVQETPVQLLGWEDPLEKG